MNDIEIFENIARLTLKQKIGDRNPTEAEIHEAVGKAAMLTGDLSEKQKESVEKDLQASFKVRMDLGEKVVDPSTYHPWLDDRKAKIDPYYWNRYKNYLIANQGWDDKVVETLGDVSDEILDLCGDPEDKGLWHRKGLILGDIQSGKTSNYLALCNKAADAGYKVIILLAGTMENLRKQTQSRVDAGFVGVNSKNALQRNPEKKFIGVGDIDSNRTAYSFTSILSDFNSTKLEALNFKINGLPEPVVFVIKKNKSVLDNMATWLSTRNTSRLGEKIDLPLLLIDDEADNASVNTHKEGEKPTAINDAICKILGLFNHSTYVGVTATPFANIFIDDSLDKGPDEFNLFPGDFIYALSAPTNYVGADRIFGEDAEFSDNLMPIEDVVTDAETGATVFRSKAKSYHTVPYLPDSLKEAIGYFLIANVIRDLDGKNKTHRSMLVNVSQYVNVQNQVYDMIVAFLKSLKLEIQSYSKLGERGLKHQKIQWLKDIWEKTGLNRSLNYSWEEIQSNMFESTAPVVVRLVNQKAKQKGVEALDYSEREENGLRVIAVGGNSLSRGLTLEGLIVSYFDRNSQMYDTLMQMGRWFGYRTGYEKLFRIWMEPTAIDWYQYITAASDELKDSINDMRRKGLTPRDFGLKVQQNKTSLFVTARNKRRATTEVTQLISLAADLVETPRLIADKERCLKINLQTTDRLINSLESEHDKFVKPEYQRKNKVVYKGVPKEIIADYIAGFVSHPHHIPFNAKDLSEYIRNDEKETWTVALVGGSLEQTLEPEYFSEAATKLGVHYSTRVIERDGSCLLISSQRARVGVPGATECGLKEDEIKRIKEEFRSRDGHNSKTTVPDKPFLAIDREPILLIYFIKIDKDYIESRKKNSDKASINLIGEYPVIAIGLGFPGEDDGKSHKVKYVLNRVSERQMFDYEDEDDDEDEY